MNSIKDRLAESMAARNMRAADIAEKTGIPKASISQYLSGYSKPKSDRIFLLASALNVSEAWLIGYDVPMEKETVQPVKSDLDSEIMHLCSQLSKEQVAQVGEYIQFLISKNK